MAGSPPDQLWIGTSTEDGKGRGRIFRFLIKDLLKRMSLLGGLYITSSQPQPQGPALRMPERANGGAVKAGRIYTTSSSAKWGYVASDNMKRSLGPGAEEIEFRGDELWGVFEAGSHDGLGACFFPVLARFDLSALKSDLDTVEHPCEP